MIFVVLIGYALGLWGVTHSAALYAIGTRSYTFETLNHRANYTYFRDREGGALLDYQETGMRMHFTGPNPAPQVMADTRPIYIHRQLTNRRGNVQDHNERLYSIAPRNREGGVEVNPVWLRIGYGICLNANCGDSSQ